MKHYALLVFSMLLMAIAVGCSKEETTSNDSDLAGVNVAVGENSGSYRKLFVLNEGNMGTNNASLDFFRFSNGNYVRNAFLQMNPEQTLGLGDVGNDIKIYKDKLYLVINNSGLIEVVNPENETHIATIAVSSPRQITFEDGYAYVTSYSGAVYGGTDRLGKVYKISTRNYELVDSVQVGYQPEGIEEHDGKLYVANSGGLKSDYSYDNTISVIDLKSFTVEKTIEVVKNLQSIVIEDNTLWVSTMGDYYMLSSGIYQVDLTTDKVISQTDTLATVRTGGKMYECDGFIYTFSNVYDSKYAVTDNTVSKINTKTGDVVTYHLGTKDVAVAYGICVNEDNGDIYIGDAYDYTNLGFVHCYDKEMTHKWKATAGVDPGHFALY